MRDVARGETEVRFGLAPSMINALVRPSLAKLAFSDLVLASSARASGHTIIAPSWALAESACLRARARSFFGRSCACERTTGPNARPPPRNCGTRPTPCRADPVPFCLYNFLPVRADVRAAERLMRSSAAFGELIAHHARDQILARNEAENGIVEVDRTGGLAVEGRSCRSSRAGPRLFHGRATGSGVRHPIFAGLRRVFWKRLFHRVAHINPAAGRSGNRALDENEAAFDIKLDNAQIQRRHPLGCQDGRPFSCS